MTKFKRLPLKSIMAVAFGAFLSPNVSAYQSVQEPFTGYTQGEYSVDQGQFNYAVKIVTPKGIAGLEPELSINYNSGQSGETILGHGFFLSGLSAITKCRQTDFDKQYDPDFDDPIYVPPLELYCLDGQKLVVREDNTYGNDYANYRTQLNSHSKIQKYPWGWEVRTKDGLTYEYGRTADSVLGDVSYAVSKIEDKLGNAIHFSYFNQNGERRIEHIAYADNVIYFYYENNAHVQNQWIGGYQSILSKRLKRIEITTDNSEISRYNLTYGLNGAEKSILTQLQECVGVNCLRPIDFNWSEQGSVSYNYSSSYSNSLSDTYFSSSNHKDLGTKLADLNGDGLIDIIQLWEGGPNYWGGARRTRVFLNNGTNFYEDATYNASIDNDGFYFADEAGKKYETDLVDLNADGLPDLVSSRDLQSLYDNSNFTQARVYINDGTRFNYEHQWGSQLAYNKAHLGKKVKESNYVSNGVHLPTGAVYQDVNGDHIPELVELFYPRGNTLDNGGVPRLRIGSGVGSKLHDYSNSLSDTFINDTDGYDMGTRLADVNGDGLVDIVQAYLANSAHGYYGNVNQHRVYLNDGDSYVYDSAFSGSLSALDMYFVDGHNRSLGVFLMDINADGMSDLVQLYDADHGYYGNVDQVRVALSTGNSWVYDHGYTQGLAPIIGGSNKTYGRRFVDVNSDGLPDFVSLYHDAVNSRFVCLNRGATFQCSGTEAANYSQQLINTDTFFEGVSNDMGTQMVDIDGNGSLDIIQLYLPTNGNYGNNPQRRVFLNGYSAVSRLVSLNNNAGQKIDIGYDSLANANVYDPGIKTAYPEIDIDHKNIEVVSSITVPDGKGGTDQTTFKYHDYRYHYEYGPLGFAKIEETDTSNNLYTVSEYFQQFKYSGIVKSTKLYSAGVLISEQINTPASFYLTNYESFNTRIKQTIKRDYTEGLLTEVINDFTSDKYGNTTKVITVTNDSIGEVKKVTSTFAYDNSETSWNLGRMTSSSVTHEVPGKPAITKTSSFSYDNIMGLLLEEIVEPGPNQLKYSYTYDVYGNLKTKTRSYDSTVRVVEKNNYSTDGKYLTSQCNAKSSCTYYYYDAYGRTEKIVGYGGATRTFEYDVFGNKVRETSAEGIVTNYTKEWYTSYSPLNNSLYRVISTTDGNAPKTTYYDIFHRKLREETLNFDGAIIRVDYQYNKNYLGTGRAVLRTTPHFSTDSIRYWIVEDYDDFGRLIRLSEPSPTGWNMNTAITYNGLSSTTRNPEYKYKTITKNALGQTIEVVEGDKTISYDYDAVGNVIAVTDPSGLASTYTYDIRGNKTSSNDHTMGYWQYFYDSNNQLIEQIDAKGVSTTYQYDELGRKTYETTAGVVKRWEYGQGFMGITWLRETTPEHTATTFFDNLGRPTKIDRTTDGITHSETYSYDSNGRLHQKVMPGGLELNYVYNNYGYLIRIESPLGAVNNFDSLHYSDTVAGLLASQSYEIEQLVEAQQVAEKYEGFYQYAAQANLLSAQKLATLNSAVLVQQKAATRFDMNALWAGQRAEHLLNQLTRYQSTLKNADFERISKAFSQSAKSIIASAEKLIAQGSSGAQVDTLLELAAKQVEQSQKYQSQAKQSVDNFVNGSSFVFYEVNEVDSFGRITKYTSGNGVETTSVYNHAGVQESSQSVMPGVATVRDMNFEYDRLGNVLTRNNVALSLTQRYTYDSYDRVTQAETTYNSGVIDTETFTYDVIGNITSKTGTGAFTSIGGYSYNSQGGKPYQLTSAGSRQFSYDANGNMTANGNTAISYNSHNLPVSIQTPNDTITFTYDANGDRVKKDNGQSTTYYFSKVYEQVRWDDGKIEDKYFIEIGGNVVAIHNKTVDAGVTSYSTDYLHHDSLGSVDAITDNTGAVILRLMYDVFGRQYTVNVWGEVDNSAAATAGLDITNRGFTGHEHIDDTNLVHMNGRVYDASIGRFISPDPHIDGVLSHHGYNRYAYARNNPLKYTDPSGFFIFSIFKAIGSVFKAVAKVAVAVVKTVVQTVANNIKPIIAVAASVVTGGLASGAIGGFLGAVAGGTVAGFTSGAILSGTIDGAFNGALWGGVGAGVAYGIGSFAASLKGASNFTRALVKSGLHGASRGAISKLRGGSFTSGLTAGAISSASSSLTHSFAGNNYALGAAISATTGGITSAIAGDKFANGAVTGAFTYMFNDAMHQYQEEQRRKAEMAKTDWGLGCHLAQLCDLSGYGGMSHYRVLNITVLGVTRVMQERWYGDKYTGLGFGWAFGPYAKADGEWASLALVNADLKPIRNTIDLLGMIAFAKGHFEAGVKLMMLAKKMPDLRIAGSVSIDVGRWTDNSGAKRWFLRINVDAGVGVVSPLSDSVNADARYGRAKQWLGVPNGQGGVTWK